METIDDLLGPITRKPAVDDLLGPAPKKRKVRKARKAATVRKYEPLKAPKAPRPNGIFALREAKGRNLGRTCLICKTELKHKAGRPPIICGKATCFRAYRNAYRADYDAARGAA